MIRKRGGTDRERGVGQIKVTPGHMKAQRNVNCKYRDDKLHVEQWEKERGRSMEKEATRLEKRLDQKRRNSARSTKTKRPKRK